MRLFNCQKPVLLFILLLLLLTGGPSSVYAINFNAYWAYRQSGGDARDTQREFQQRYSLGLGPAITYQPTHAIRATGAVGYTRTQSDAGKGDGFTATDALSPSARVSLVNDIFLADISGLSDLQSTKNADSTRSSWETSLGSAWSIPLVPSLRINYGEIIEAVDELKVFNASGEKEQNTSISVNWDLILAQTSYGYTNYKDLDPVGNSLYDSDTHFARFATDGSFWNNRLSFQMAQQFTYSTSDFIIEGDDGSIDFPLEGDTYAKITDPGTPDDLPPEDDDYEDPDSPLPQEVAVDERVHLYFDGEFPEQIDTVRLTLEDSFTIPQALELRWTLYIRNNQFDSWERRLDNLQGEETFDEDNSIDISIGFLAAEVLLVAENDSSVALTFTALQALRMIIETSSQTTTNYLTTTGLGYRITPTLKASANLTVEQAEVDFEEDQPTETDRRTMSANLQWSPAPYIRPALNFSEYLQESNRSPDDLNRTYSLTVLTIPLESMLVTFGATRNERFLGDVKMRNSDTYRVTTAASIYPDLSADWNLSYSDVEALQDDGLVSFTDTISSRLSLNAKLYRYLFGDFITNYTHRKRETETFQDASAQFNLRYRPSDLLALRGGYTTFFLDSETDDQLNLNLSLFVINTYKARLTLAATHIQARETSDNFSFVGSWDISRYLTLLTQGNYRLADRDSYNFRINLGFRL